MTGDSGGVPLKDFGVGEQWVLSPGMLTKPRRNTPEGYWKLADVTSPFPRAQRERCLLLGVIILENSSPATSGIGSSERASTDLRELGRVQGRQKCIPTLISPPCQITACVGPRSQVALGGFLPEQYLPFSWAELRGKTSVTIREFFVGIHRTLCFFLNYVSFSDC